jgi:uncharacterized cupredoxin-like copper-binding protein
MKAEMRQPSPSATEASLPVWVPGGRKVMGRFLSEDTRVRHHMRWLPLVVLAATLVSVGTACSKDDEPASAASESAAGLGSTVNATIGGNGEYSISLDSKSVKAGKVTFKITNKGAEEHEFVIVKTGVRADKLPVKNGEVDEDGVNELAKPLEVEDIEAGASAKLVANLEAGHYVLICNLQGHYGHGMQTAFRVTA